MKPAPSSHNPFIPADVLSRAHAHARKTIRQSRPFLIAGLVLMGAGATLSDLDLFLRAGLLAWGGMFTGISSLARYRAFRVLRSGATASTRSLQDLGVPSRVLAEVKPAEGTVTVADVPPDARELLDQMRIEGRRVGERSLTTSELTELQRRYYQSVSRFALGLSFGAFALLILAGNVQHEGWLLASMVTFLLIMKALYEGVKGKSNSRVRVILYPQKSSGVEWAEYLGKSDLAWTVDGEPAEWRLK